MMNEAYTYQKLVSDLSWLQKQFPFIQCNEIGTSVMGRKLYEMRIGNGKKFIHYNASFHANEWITSLVLMNWVYQLSRNIDVETLEKVQLSIVPMVNPDGIELVHGGATAAEGLYNVEEMNNYKKDYCGWKANIRGVDLNKQFPANWDKYKQNVYCHTPYYRDYPGDAPLTEPEVIAMKHLVENNCFDYVIALHTQGKEFYWGYQGLEPSHSHKLAEEFERVSGYRAVQYTSSHAGFRDWFISEYQKPGFTLELGKGLNPLPLSQFLDIYQETSAILNASVYL